MTLKLTDYVSRNSIQFLLKHLSVCLPGLKAKTEEDRENPKNKLKEELSSFAFHSVFLEASLKSCVLYLKLLKIKSDTQTLSKKLKLQKINKLRIKSVLKNSTSLLKIKASFRSLAHLVPFSGCDSNPNSNVSTQWVWLQKQRNPLDKIIKKTYKFFVYCIFSGSTINLVVPIS